jgi:hypothetical protein
MAKTNFSANTNALLSELVVTGGDFKEKRNCWTTPSISLVNNEIKIYDAGQYKDAYVFHRIGTINAVAPTDIVDAYTKLVTLIATIVN